MSFVTPKLAGAADSGWRLLAWVLDPRSLLVIFALLTLALPIFIAKPAWWLDQQLFSFGAWIKKDKIQAADYVRINLPDDEVQKLLRDPLQARASLQFLHELQQVPTQASMLLLPAPLWADYRTNELLRLHGPVIQAAVPPAIAQQLSQLNLSLRHYTALLGNTQLLKAYHAPSQNDQASLMALLLKDESFTALKWLSEPLSAGYPLYTDSGLTRPMLWQAQQGAWPDARLALLMAKYKVAQINWRPQQGIEMQGSHWLHTALNSSLIPIYSSDSGKQFKLQTYPLSAMNNGTIRRDLQQKIVVIAAESDPYADDLLQTVASVIAGEYLTLSPWFVPLHIVIVLALLLYFTMQPRLPTRLSLIITAAIGITLLLTQQYVLLMERHWLPIGHFLLFLISGHVLMFLIIVRRRFYTSMDFEKTMTLMSRTASPSTTKKGSQRQEPVMSESKLETVARSGRQFGRYDIIRELGRGAMGVVYLGYDPALSRYVAIKTLNIDAESSEDAHLIMQRFKAEAHAAASLSHPNIVTIFEFGETESGSAYIAMDFVDGAPLSVNTKPDTLLDAKVVCWLIAQVADAVGAAHKSGIVHRDIKPSNILFDPNKPEVKVADFGIAKALNAGQTRTRTGDILGSPLYMSPEQISGQPATPASDVFSIGVTLYQLLTGELPFRGDNIATLSMQIVKAKPRPLNEFRADLPTALQKIINTALHKNPERRFKSALEMADALKKLLQGNQFK